MIKEVSTLYDKGLIRDVNQDSIFYKYTKEEGIFVVADGMGGYSEGEKASQFIVKDLEDWWLVISQPEYNYDITDLSELCQKRLIEINKKIYLNYKIDNSFGGSTVVVLLIKDGKYCILHAGDSRAYLFGKNKNSLLTKDDVWENLTSTIDNFTPEEIENNSNKGKLTISIGSFENVSIHSMIESITEDGIIFLCSDGIYKHCNYDFLNKTINSGNPLKKELKKKMQLIEKEVRNNGATDNYSSIAVKIVN